MSRTPNSLTHTNGYLGAVSPWALVVIFAACGGDEPTAPDGQVALVSVTPASVTLMPGEPVMLSASAKDSQGKLLFRKTFTWTSSDTSVAAIEPFTAGINAYVLSAVGEGSATITVTTEGQSFAVAVTVAVGEFFEFSSVVMGWDYSCGIAASGAAYCWGGNSSGQLGNGTIAPSTNSGTPARVSGERTFASLSGGGGHVCGITTSGAAYCWGLNNEGQLGNGTIEDSGIPVPVSEGLTFASVSAGERHTCGVTTAGAAYCWGQGENGRLGNGTTTTSPTPVRVSDELTFASIDAGHEWHTCGVTTTGAAYCWGEGRSGQLGNGTTNSSPTPVAVSGGLTFASVRGGVLHTCGLTTSGEAYCWGDNEVGSLGDGTTTNSTTPVAVSGGLTFASLSGGASHACGVTASGAAYCWGLNDFGQLGNGTRTDFFDANPTPLPVSGRLTFASVRGSIWHTCGVTTSGVAYCWGNNQVGMLGSGPGSLNAFKPMPARVLGQP